MARLGEVRLFEELRIMAAVMTPRGLWASPSDDHGMSVQMAHEYILVTMRGVPDAMTNRSPVA